MLSRRSFIGLAAAFAATPALAAEHPSIAFMKQVGKDLLHAHRQGTVTAFMRVIQRHADVGLIGDYSLGSYKSRLKDGQKQKYYRGVANFMARYFAEQSRDYPVAKYEVGEATVTEDKDILVSSKVFLMSGQVYRVTWRVAWRGGRYKVTDAKVAGFSLTFLQRNLFASFLAKRNGDVGQLIVALNR
jgi:phospholipid transport system substrate-binding protein